MTRAQQLANRLLEADPDEIAPKDYVNAIDAENKSGVVNSTSAMTANTFYHRKMTYKGRPTEPLQVRRNGRTQTWKTRPGKFRIPCKYGMYEYFDITDENAHEWSTIPKPPQ